MHAQFNALLFYELARFVVWAERHRDFAAADAELGDLVENASALLARAGERG